jgi:hypothetical protein
MMMMEIKMSVLTVKIILCYKKWDAGGGGCR